MVAGTATASTQFGLEEEQLLRALPPRERFKRSQDYELMRSLFEAYDAGTALHPIFRAALQIRDRRTFDRRFAAHQKSVGGDDLRWLVVEDSGSDGVTLTALGDALGGFLQSASEVEVASLERTRISPELAHAFTEPGSTHRVAEVVLEAGVDSKFLGALKPLRIPTSVSQNGGGAFGGNAYVVLLNRGELERVQHLPGVKIIHFSRDLDLFYNLVVISNPQPMIPTSWNAPRAAAFILKISRALAHTLSSDPNQTQRILIETGTRPEHAAILARCKALPVKVRSQSWAPILFVESRTVTSSGFIVAEGRARDLASLLIESSPHLERAELAPRFHGLFAKPVFRLWSWLSEARLQYLKHRHPKAFKEWLRELNDNEDDD